MNIKPIRNDQDLAHAFAQLQAVFQADEGTPEADRPSHGSRSQQERTGEGTLGHI